MKTRAVILSGILACAGYFVASGEAGKVVNRYGLNEKFNKTWSLVSDKFEKKNDYADAIFGKTSSAEATDFAIDNPEIVNDTVHVQQQEIIRPQKPVMDTVYVNMKEITDTVTVPEKNKVYIPLDNLLKQGKKVKIK